MDNQLNNTDQNENRNDERDAFEKPTPQPRKLKLIYKLLIGAGAALLASGLGILLPVVGMLTILVVLLAVMAGLVVYGAADMEGLCAYLVLYEALMLLIGGVMMGAAMLLIVVLPLALMVLLDMKRVPFFKRMYLSLAIELVCMVLALGLIVLVYRENIGDLTVKMLKSSFEQISPGMKDAMVLYYKQLYGIMGMELRYETAEELLTVVAETTGEYVKLALPAMLILLASVNVLPGAKLCSGIRVKRNIPGETSEPLSKWRMGEQMVIGLLLIMVTGLVLQWTIGTRGEVVMYTAIMLGLVACTVQTLASLADHFGRTPAGPRIGIAVLMFLFLLLFQAIPLYGALSMLIGSHGLITQWLKRRNSNRQDPEEPF